MNTSTIKKPRATRNAKKKKVVTGVDGVEAVANKVINDINQSLNQSETGGDDDSIQIESQETPRGGAGAEDGNSMRNGDDSISYGKSMVSEADDEEKKSDTQSSRKGDAQLYPSPDKYERILDVLKSEEKDATWALEAQAQTEAIELAEAQEAEVAGSQKISDEDLTAELLKKQEELEAEQKRIQEQIQAEQARAEEERIAAERAAAAKLLEEQEEAQRKADLAEKKRLADAQAAAEKQKQEQVEAERKKKEAEELEELNEERARVGRHLKEYQVELSAIKTMFTLVQNHTLTSEEDPLPVYRQLSTIIQRLDTLEEPTQDKYVRKESFKSSLSYLESGLLEVSSEKSRLSELVQSKMKEAELLVKIRTEEREHLQRSRDFINVSEFDAAIKELEKVENLHQEKTQLWIQIEKLQSEESDKRARLEASERRRAEEEEQKRAALNQAQEAQARQEAAQEEQILAAKLREEEEAERQRQIIQEINRQSALAAQEKAQRAELEEAKRAQEEALAQLQREAEERVEQVQEAAIPVAQTEIPTLTNQQPDTIQDQKRDEGSSLGPVAIIGGLVFAVAVIAYVVIKKR